MPENPRHTVVRTSTFRISIQGGSIRAMLVALDMYSLANAERGLFLDEPIHTPGGARPTRWEHRAR